MGLFTNIKLIGIAGIGVLLVLALWHYNSIVTDLENERTLNKELTASLKISNDTIEKIRNDAEEAAKIHKKVSEQFTVIQLENKKLSSTIRTHDLAKLASKKPLMIQNIINDGTADSFRCFEILSGSELTEDELNATKPSQINRSCASLANPNYKVQQ